MLKGIIYPTGISAVCEICGKSVGFVSWVEAVGMQGMGLSIQCFCCEGSLPDLVPVEFIPTSRGVVMLGKKGEGQVSIAMDDIGLFAVQKES